MPYDCAAGKHGAIGNWDVTAVTDMRYVFYGNKDNKQGHYVLYAESFNGDISKWDVSRVTNMLGMFAYAKRFNGDISKWSVSRVTTFEDMFHTAERFNVDISKWDVSGATTMKNMFYNAVSFSQTLGGSWSTSKADKTGMLVGSKNMSECIVHCVTLTYLGMHPHVTARLFTQDLIVWMSKCVRVC